MPLEKPSFPENGSEPSEPGQLLTHARFAGHFTAAIYDPDDRANDDSAPFRGDEGADLYAEWVERVDELESLTLRQMLELEEDPGGSTMSASDPIVIAAAFIHLRATGWIDREGAAWLHAALVRSDQDNPDTEFAVMLDDLATYSNKAPQGSKAAR